MRSFLTHTTAALAGGGGATYGIYRAQELPLGYEGFLILGIAVLCFAGSYLFKKKS